MEYKMRQKKKWQYAQEIYSFPKLIQGSPETCTTFLEDMSSENSVLRT